MTSRTADAFIDMNRVIEIGEVRQIMHAYPFQRLAVFEAIAHRLEIRTVGPNLFVAIHTDRSRRHSGRGRCLHTRMAITAIDAVITDVVLMTELNWLLALDVSARIPASARDVRCYPEGSEKDKNGAVYRRALEIVCAVTKNLWHYSR